MFRPFKKIFAKKRNVLILYSVTVLIASYFTYFKNYDYPSAVFWDENYHIASAQKYLEGAMFMETHPPLGKLFVALGEYALRPNKTVPVNELHKFTQTDYIKDFPAGYSFAGVRFFSVFFAWLSALLFFYIFYFISKNPHTALLFSSLYIFENAMITHSRAAMLEGSHLFFILLTVLYFIHLFQKKNQITILNYLIFGALAGFAISIKATGAIVFLLFPFLWVWTKKATSLVASHKRQAMSLMRNFIYKGLIFIIGAGLVFISVWQIHFSLGKKIEGDKIYKASEQYKTIIADGEAGKWKNFPTAFKDNMAFMANYNKGVPVLDVCKPDENGSHPMTWPLGDKSINYRWEKNGDGVRYMYLQSNPVIWFLGLIAVILSITLLASKFIFKLPVKDKKIFYLIAVFAALYLFYMAMMLNITRVMYLYHYFIPLTFSLILVYLQFNYLFGELLTRKPKVIYLSIIILVVSIVWTYNFFSPFSYYQPLTTEQFNKRMWFDFWKLKPVE